MTRPVTALAIVQIGHPTLREQAREVRADELGSAELLRICDDLVETMRAANGAGLAAPQVDIPLRVFAVEVGDNPRYPYKPRLGLRVFVNPVVRPLGDETYESYEGCLSIPDLRGFFPGATEVEVTYLDPGGAEHTERFGGLSAGTMQHELDHLDGILFPDRVKDPTTLCTWEMFRAYRQKRGCRAFSRCSSAFPARGERGSGSASPAPRPVAGYGSGRARSARRARPTLPARATWATANFVQLAQRDYYRSVTIHRVVPNFVIQDGDPRGDGNGGPGYQIRCEINQVLYDRAAVGMALSGKDTGGSQWFVTHSPQPHLDGGYTVFGRVITGMDVVDKIVRGDVIQSITIKQGPPRKRG